MRAAGDDFAGISRNGIHTTCSICSRPPMITCSETTVIIASCLAAAHTSGCTFLPSSRKYHQLAFTLPITDKTTQANNPSLCRYVVWTSHKITTIPGQLLEEAGSVKPLNSGANMPTSNILASFKQWLSFKASQIVILDHNNP